ncbi:GNAT family N-acetyltransferase [Microvirga pudoricolor]|uniref:GNAT family N-acetyltransferase n=1 Tax=Microvirga pudoricolor TaxID=2778729 RepID=UPI0019516C5C|nr:GNAT family N-acetyltransferase [Microvirga pudoricolor]MBM6592786.1 GNAT family N-acetyltransferase [Microvirga pudoricolor]
MGGVAPPSNPDGEITTPAALTPEHDLSQFDCGQSALNLWLQQKARPNDGPASRTYVVCAGSQVIGYYCLSTGGVRHDDVPGKLKRNMPNPVPIMVLGRLAVDHRFQRQGIGGGLLKDALKRTLAAWRLVGFRALVVHAKSDDALTFYRSYGFIEYPSATRTLLLPIEGIARIFG